MSTGCCNSGLLSIDLTLNSNCCPPAAQSSVSGNGKDSLIRVDQDDFADATHWNGTNEEGIVLEATDKIKVFDNNTNRFLDEDTEWERTATGVHFLIDGFDATVNEYKFYIHINKA